MMAYLTGLILSAILFVNPAPKIPYGSIAPIVYNGHNVCTAFSINERQGYWATASHCFDDFRDITIHDFPLDLMVDNFQADIAVLRGPHTTALTVSNDQPYAWTPVYKYGYGNGWSVGWASFGRFTDTVIFNPCIGHLVVLFDLAVRPGDSGSPIMTHDNKVVSIAEMIFTGDVKKKANDRGIEHPSGGIDTEGMYEVLEPYLPK